MKKYFALIPLFIFAIYSVAFAGFKDREYSGKEELQQEKMTNEKKDFQESELNGIIPGDGTLGTAIREGTIELHHATDLIFYWINYLTKIIGSVAVFMIVVGGFQYVIGSVVDEKEKGKKTMMYALVGVFIAFCSWMAINWIQEWYTS
jgi:hypothetical protein